MKIVKTIELEYKNIQATSLCKAKNDVRFYLTGIYIGDGFIASTNGHILFIAEQDQARGMDLIIPAEAVDSLIKKVKNKPKLKKVNLHQLEDGFWLLDHVLSYELFKPVDGKFPDVKRVDIQKPTGINFKDFPKFDFKYLTIFEKIAKIMGLKESPMIFPTTEKNSAYVELTDKAHGIMMPMRF